MGHTHTAEKRNVNRVLVGESEGKRPLGRPRDRWDIHIQQRREMRTKFQWGNLKERDHLADPEIDGTYTYSREAKYELSFSGEI